MDKYQFDFQPNGIQGSASIFSASAEPLSKVIYIFISFSMCIYILYNIVQ